MSNAGGCPARSTDSSSRHGCSKLPSATAATELEGTLRSLGYTGPLPQHDLHATPSFEFVADCLLWLCQR